MLVVAACAGPVPDSIQSVSGAILQSVSGAILGGQPDMGHAAVMALSHPVGANDRVMCSGTVLHVQDRSALLLTAAHCVVTLDDAGDVRLPVTALPPDGIAITPGPVVANDLFLGRAFQAVAVAVPAGYNGHNGNPDDIALVRFVGAVPATPRLAALPLDHDQPHVGSAVTLVGFGRTEQAGQSGVRRMTSKSVGWLNANFIGFDQTDGHGVCQGDSGGPVLVTDGDHEAVAAVNSIARGTASAPCNEAGTTVRVSRAADLMTRMVAATPPALDCESCLQAEQAPGNACAAGNSCAGACAEYVRCIDGCSDGLCFFTCQAAHVAGAEQYAANLAGKGTCASARCTLVCPKAAGCTTVPGRPGQWAWSGVAVLALLRAMRIRFPKKRRRASM
ncbi:MAG TPA: trypsin-like serine protease [Polyangia bacterium]|nr:trypsin-like serine protease [Polyangia bacterium]